MANYPDVLGWAEALSEKTVAIANLGFLFPGIVFLLIWHTESNSTWFVLAVVEIMVGVYLISATKSMRLTLNVAATRSQRRFRRKLKEELPSPKMLKRRPLFSTAAVLWYAFTAIALILAFSRKDQVVFAVVFLVNLTLFLLIFFGGLTGREPVMEFIKR